MPVSPSSANDHRGDASRTRRSNAGVISSMERWQFIGWGIAASVLAHFLLAGAIFLSTEVHTYDPDAADPIPVDVIRAEEPVKPPEPTPTPAPIPTPTSSP